MSKCLIERRTCAGHVEGARSDSSQHADVRCLVKSGPSALFQSRKSCLPQLFEVKGVDKVSD